MSARQVSWHISVIFIMIIRTDSSVSRLLGPKQKNALSHTLWTDLESPVNT